eukprot:g110.t1
MISSDEKKHPSVDSPDEWFTVSQGVADGHLESEDLKKPLNGTYVEFPSSHFEEAPEDEGDYVPPTVPGGFFKKQAYAVMLQRKTLEAVRKLREQQEKQADLCSLCTKGVEFVERAASIDLKAGEDFKDVKRLSDPLEFTCKLLTESFPDLLHDVRCDEVQQKVTDAIEQALHPKDPCGNDTEEDDGDCVTKHITLSLKGCGFLGVSAATACPLIGSPYVGSLEMALAAHVREMEEELRSLHRSIEPDAMAIHRAMKSERENSEDVEKIVLDL